jgi:putative redox protein
VPKTVKRENSMAITIVRDQMALMRHEVRIGPYSFGADVSADEGGQGLGANPHDLYDAALGACEALTVLWYANHKGIPVGHIEITVERDQSEEKSGTYRLDTKLSIGGAMTQSQRQELLSVASKCPVHKLMTSVQTVIKTTLVE